MRIGKHTLRPLLPAVLLALLAGATACGPFGRGNRDRVVLIPPLPTPHSIEPAEIEGEFRTGYYATLLKTSIVAATYTPETTDLLEEARGRFGAGESFYKQGDFYNARRLFEESIEMLLASPEEASDRHRVKALCAELSEAVYRYDTEGLDASVRKPGFEASPLDDILASTFPVDPNIALTVREELKLPVSELPIEVNGEVMHYINYFSSRGRLTIETGLRRMGSYKAMIQRILDEEGVPQELMFAALAESGYQPRALSRKRATGMWQFMRLRASEYGLGRTSYFDDRLDPEKSTRAAARHLRDLYERLGDWYLAIAAYNGGPGRITRAVRRTGYADFWELHKRRALPRETRNFVPIILASIIMANNPKEYGLEDIVPDPPLEYSTIEVAAETHLGLIADVLGRSIEEIREFNPALLKDVAPPGYTVHLPKGTEGYVVAALKTVPASRRADWRVHRMSYGQTLSQIAELYQITPEQISVANGGGGLAPETGDFVVVPVSYTPSKSGSQTGKRNTRGGSGSSGAKRPKTVSSGG